MSAKNEELILEELRSIKTILQAVGEFLPLVSKVVNLHLECIENQAKLINVNMAIFNNNLTTLPGTVGEVITTEPFQKNEQTE